MVDIVLLNKTKEVLSLDTNLILLLEDEDLLNKIVETSESTIIETTHKRNNTLRNLSYSLLLYSDFIFYFPIKKILYSYSYNDLEFGPDIENGIQGNENIKYSMAETKKLYDNLYSKILRSLNGIEAEDDTQKDTKNFIMISDATIHQILFSFKYSNIKNFFRDNYTKFLPEVDIKKIQSDGRAKLFQKTLMQEFDKFSDIIYRISDINDIDKVPTEYLNYLGQLLGYERDGDTIINDEMYRFLLKNIIEIYKVKGTNYSYELFFNFLGFGLEINEYWFDRRFFNSKFVKNPYTGEIYKNKFTYYLTPNKPYEIAPYELTREEKISEKDISKQMGLHEFNRLGETFDPGILLGYKKNITGAAYRGTKFKFFKTNVVEFKITSLEFTVNSENNLDALKNYINFLTPITVIKVITFSTTFPEEDFSKAGILKEDYNYLMATVYSYDNLSDFDDEMWWKLKEGEFNNYFVFPKEYRNDLRYLASFFNLSPDKKTKPTLDISNAFRPVENYCENVQIQYIKKYLDYSEVWVLNNGTIKLRAGNEIYIKYPKDRRNSGTYIIQEALPIKESSIDYIKIKIPKVSGDAQTTSGGFALFNRDPWSLSKARYSLLFDKSIIITTIKDNVIQESTYA